MPPAQNSPFPDLVILIVDHAAEYDAKIRYYASQGYRVTSHATRFEDITVDLQGVNGSVTNLPMKGAVVVHLMRVDPT